MAYVDSMSGTVHGTYFEISGIVHGTCYDRIYNLGHLF